MRGILMMFRELLTKHKKIKDLVEYCHKYIPFIRDQLKCFKYLSKACFEEKISDFLSDLLMTVNDDCDYGCNCHAKYNKMAALLSSNNRKLSFDYLAPTVKFDQKCEVMTKEMMYSLFNIESYISIFDLTKENLTKCDDAIIELMFSLPQYHRKLPKQIMVCENLTNTHRVCLEQDQALCHSKQELDLFIRVIFAIMNIWVEVGNTIFQEICSYSSVSNSAMVHGALSSWHDFCGVVDIFQNNFESDSCKKEKAELLLLPASQQSYSNNGMIRILHHHPSSKLEWIIFVVVQHYLYLSMKEIHLLY